MHSILGLSMLTITTLMTATPEFYVNSIEIVIIMITVYLCYHLEITYKGAFCSQCVTQRNLLEFRGMLNNLKDGIFIARRDQRLQVDYINRAAKILLSKNPVDLETGLLLGHG